MLEHQVTFFPLEIKHVIEETRLESLQTVKKKTAYLLKQLTENYPQHTFDDIK